jgi:hypothetical protein
MASDLTRSIGPMTAPVPPLLLLVVSLAASYACGRLAWRLVFVCVRGAVGDPAMATRLVYLVFAPGVAVHELSHAIAAVCLRVRVRTVVLFGPGTGADGDYLGFVEHDACGSVRGALIGTAPILGQVAAVALIARGLGVVPSGADPLPGIAALVAAAVGLGPWGVLVWYAFLTLAATNQLSASDVRPIGAAAVLVGGAGMLLWSCADWLPPRVLASAANAASNGVAALAPATALTALTSLAAIAMLAAVRVAVRQLRGLVQHC